MEGCRKQKQRKRGEGEQRRQLLMVADSIVG